MPIVEKVLINEEDINKEPKTDTEWPLKTRFIDLIEKIIRQNLEKFGDSLWLTDVSTERSMSYSQLLLSIDSLAGSFRKRGFRRGDTLVIMAASHLESPVTVLSAWKAGGTVACLALNLLKGTLEERIRQLRPKFIVADQLRVGQISEVVRGLDFVQEIFTIEKSNGFTSIGDLLLKDESEFSKNVEVDDDDSKVWVMYSSGTTGIQKGIIHTHKSLGRFFLNYFDLKNIKKGKKCLFTSLMTVPSGMLIVLLQSIVHSPLYCLSNFSCLDHLLAAIDSVKPFTVRLYPCHITAICRHSQLNKYDLSSVVTISTVGSKIHPTYERQIFDILPNLLHLNIVYGMNETGVVCSNLINPAELIDLDKPKAIARHVFGSCGKVKPGCKLKIVDRETGETLGPGQEGEICVQTPSMLKEYLDMPEEMDLLMKDGWCYTGDKGYYDTNENVFFVCRYKELILYRNMHVVPTHIEKQMMTHPAVEDVGVIGIPHELDGEVPVAFVVLRSGMTFSPQESIDFTNAGELTTKLFEEEYASLMKYQETL